MLAALAARAERRPRAPLARRVAALDRGAGDRPSIDVRSTRRSTATSTRRAARRRPRVALAPHAARRLLPPRPAGAVRRHALDARRRRAALRRRRAAPASARRCATAASRDGAVLVADNASGDVLAYVGGSGDLSSAAPRRRHPARAARPARRSSRSSTALALEQRLLTAGVAARRRAARDRRSAAASSGRATTTTQFRGLVSRAHRAGRLAQRPGGARAAARSAPTRSPSGCARSASTACGGPATTTVRRSRSARPTSRCGSWSTPIARSPTAACGRRCGSQPTATRAAPGAPRPALASRGGGASSSPTSSPTATAAASPSASRARSRRASGRAVKTGTSKDMRDNWCVGFSRRYTVGVWVGNFSGAPMHDVSGVTGAAPIWAEVMDWLHRDGGTRRRPSPPRDVERDRATSGSSPAPRRWPPRRTRFGAAHRRADRRRDHRHRPRHRRSAPARGARSRRRRRPALGGGWPRRRRRGDAVAVAADGWRTRGRGARCRRPQRRQRAFHRARQPTASLVSRLRINRGLRGSGKEFADVGGLGFGCKARTSARAPPRRRRRAGGTPATTLIHRLCREVP